MTPTLTRPSGDGDPPPPHDGTGTTFAAAASIADKSTVTYDTGVKVFTHMVKMSIPIAGIPQPVLSSNGTNVNKYIPPNWCSHTWNFNDKYGLTVHRETKPWLHIQRENDRFIMEALSSLPTATNAQLRASQCCRLFLGVTTLADITTTDGTKLAHWITDHAQAHTDTRRQPTLLWKNG